MNIVLKESSRKGKKFMVKVDNKTIHFGQEGASDYTKNKDDDRKNKYIVRHTKRENWNKSGIKTAGFWSRWLLWNKKTLKGSIKDTEKRFDITIKKE
tara:strand:+ start:4841 stop:5131 length:291 start_codon:yes stop_codon:yes gene_type:complete